MTAQNLMKARISIHALHEESDSRCKINRKERHISIHALHEESESEINQHAQYNLFQSTLSMRRAKCSWTFLSAF